MFLLAVVVSLFWIVRWKHKRINIRSGCPLSLCALLFFASRNWLLSKCQTKLIADNRTEQVWPLLSEPCRAAERLVNRSRRLFSECLLLFLNEQDRNTTNELIWALITNWCDEEWRHSGMEKGALYFSVLVTRIACTYYSNGNKLCIITGNKC